MNNNGTNFSQFTDAAQSRYPQVPVHEVVSLAAKSKKAIGAWIKQQVTGAIDNIERTLPTMFNQIESTWMKEMLSPIMQSLQSIKKLTNAKENPVSHMFPLLSELSIGNYGKPPSPSSLSQNLGR